jgi:prophage antirepressor-like protein
MQNQLQVFENKEFGKIRVVEINDQPWFIGADVTKKLGYRNSRDALSKHVDVEDKGVAKCDTLRGLQNLTIINESGLYSLILTSKLPAAKAFKRWVTFEVLPSVRRHGVYITDEILRKVREDEGYVGELIYRLTIEKSKNAALVDRVDTLTPKARYHDVILQCENAVQISIIAKDYGMTAAAFNKLLHGLKVQYKMGGTWLLYQEHADKGYTLTRTYHVNDWLSTIHTYWTQSGRCFLYDLLKCYGILPLVERPGGALIGGGGDSCP